MSQHASGSIDVSISDPLAAVRAAAARGRGGTGVRRLALPAVVLAAAVTVAFAAPHAAHAFTHALLRAIHADPRWVIAGLALECASFAGYIALFRHVAGGAAPRIGMRASYELTLAGAAITRLLPTAGAGGAALTFWGLRRAGLGSGAATRALLTFLVLLYSVFLGAIAVAGTMLGAGVTGKPVSPWLTTVPAVAAATGIGVALLLAFGPRRRGPLGSAVRDGCRQIAHPHVRLLGAPAWWGFDMLVLWSTFHAFGVSPAPLVLVLGYFLGQVANTLPLPGAASGGMVGAFIAFGLPAPMVIPAVLAYRAIAIWAPVPAGAAALGGLRRTVRRWTLADGPGEPRDDRSPRRARQPRLDRPLAPAAVVAVACPDWVEGGERAPPAGHRATFPTGLHNHRYRAFRVELGG